MAMLRKEDTNTYFHIKGYLNGYGDKEWPVLHFGHVLGPVEEAEAKAIAEGNAKKAAEEKIAADLKAVADSKMEKMDGVEVEII